MFSLTGGAFLLLFGKAADVFGRRLLLVGSFLVFGAVCLGSGFCRTAVGLDALNGAAGVLTASAVPAAQGILGTAYGQRPSRRKNRAFACFSAGNPLGFVFGVVFGGVVEHLANWRAVYWLLAGLALVCGVVAFFTVPADVQQQRPPIRQLLIAFDPLGLVLAMAGIGLLCVALTCGSTASQGWRTSWIIALLVVGCLLLVAFVVWELRCPAPLVPMGIWRDRNFSLVMASLALGFMAFPPGTFFLSLYFQRVWDKSPLMTGVCLLPMAVVGVLVNLFAGLFLHRIKGRMLMITAASAYVACFILLAVNRKSSSYWSFCFPGLVLVVVGADLKFNVANMYVASTMAPQNQSVAGAIMQTLAKLSQSVGLGVTTAVFDAVQARPRMGTSYWDTASQPYAACMWFAAAATAVGLLLTLFITLGTQGGGSTDKEKTRDQVCEEETT